MSSLLLPASLSLEGRIAYITGATGGLGASIAQTLAARGASLVLAGRNPDALSRLADTLSQQNGLILDSLSYDLADSAAITTALQGFARQHKQLDILINAAGIMTDAPLGMIGNAAIQETLQINLTASLHHMQYAARLMMKQKSGCIINFSSIVGIHGSAGQTLYAASKAAIVGATKSAAKELASQGIRVNAIAPGFIDTALTARYSPEQKQAILTKIGMQRAGTPEEVAELTAFLASDAARYISGQVIGIDGGMVL